MVAAVRASTATHTTTTTATTTMAGGQQKQSRKHWQKHEPSRYVLWAKQQHETLLTFTSDCT